MSSLPNSEQGRANKCGDQGFAQACLGSREVQVGGLTAQQGKAYAPFDQDEWGQGGPVDAQANASQQVEVEKVKEQAQACCAECKPPRVDLIERLPWKPKISAKKQVCEEERGDKENYGEADDDAKCSDERHRVRSGPWAL